MAQRVQLIQYPRFRIFEDDFGVRDLGCTKSVMLTDLVYFADQEQELDQWCQDNGAHRSDMIIDFPSEAVLSLFIMRWS